MLAPQSFISAGGEPLCQLSFAEVTPQARGIAFCSAQQFAQFVANFKPFCVEALGIISTTEIAPEACAGAPVSSIRFPAIYGPTIGAILLSGSLLQLGDEQVQLSREDISEVDVVETKACKLVVFQDETSIPWRSMTQAPIRSVMSQVSHSGFSPDGFAENLLSRGLL